MNALGLRLGCDNRSDLNSGERREDTLGGGNILSKTIGAERSMGLLDREGRICLPEKGRRNMEIKEEKNLW